jgi:hydrogenase maturation protein HypF
MPFHYLLFNVLKVPALIMTSGNISDEPIVIDNEKARDVFKDIADAVIVYNRDIYNRVDDSVTAVFSGVPRVLRRSRGMVPSPVNCLLNVDSVLAVGAELKNCFALGKGKKAIIGQHIGDLKNLETYEFFKESLGRFQKLYRVEPVLAACDLHPDYLSTRFAEETGLPLVRVQHHHAHIASCLAEHGIDTTVIGVAFDGTGMGEDGAVWGGEFLVGDASHYERAAHLRYVPLPGGDKAIEEPWRMAAAYIYDLREDNDRVDFVSQCTGVEQEKIDLLYQILTNEYSGVYTSSMGRLFDAVASLLGLCARATFEAEGTMRLETICDEKLQLQPYKWKSENGIIDTRPVIDQVCHDIKNKTNIHEIATRFHLTVVDIVGKTCETIRKSRGVESVVLSGGCFQNRFIFEQSHRQLVESGFTVYSHSSVPCNDGGIALGQLVVAAKRRESNGLSS